MNIRYLSSPAFVNIYLTNACNLKCTHCIDSAGCLSSDERNLEMTDEEIYSIIDFYINKGVYSFSFSGGEPLLHPSVFEFYKYIRKRSESIDTILITNGTLITSEVIKKIEDAGISYVRVSLESHKAEVHDKIRGKNNFSLLMDKISMLNKSNIPRVGVATTVSKLNFEDIDDTFEYIYNKLNIRNITLAPLMPAGRGKNMEQDVLEPLDFKKLHLKKLEWTEKYKDVNVTMDSPLEALLNHELGIETEFCAPCSIGTCFLGFKANGDIYACPMRDEVIIGNIRTDDLDDVWENSKFLNRIRDLSLLSSKCQKCEVVDECAGGCRAYTHIKTGDVLEADPFCWRKGVNS